MWIKFNPNPCGRNVEDCTIRALCAALEISWDEGHDLLAEASKAMCDMQHSSAALGAILRRNGFYRHAIPNDVPDDYTAQEFAYDHPRGVYVLGFGGHVATAIDGDIYDSWDSRNEIPMYYWSKEQDHGRVQ